MRCELAPKSRPVRCALLCQNKTGHTEAGATFSCAHTLARRACSAAATLFEPPFFFRPVWGCARKPRGLYIGLAVLTTAMDGFELFDL